MASKNEASKKGATQNIGSTRTVNAAQRTGRDAVSTSRSEAQISTAANLYQGEPKTQDGSMSGRSIPGFCGFSGDSPVLSLNQYTDRLVESVLALHANLSAVGNHYCNASTDAATEILAYMCNEISECFNRPISAYTAMEAARSVTNSVLNYLHVTIDGLSDSKGSDDSDGTDRPYFPVERTAVGRSVLGTYDIVNGYAYLSRSRIADLKNSLFGEQMDEKEAKCTATANTEIGLLFIIDDTARTLSNLRDEIDDVSARIVASF